MTDLITTFPDCLPVIKKNLAFRRKQLRKAAKLVEEGVYIGIDIWIDSGADEATQQEGIKALHDFLTRKFIVPIERHVKRLENLQYLYKKKDEPVSDGEIIPKDIEKAKTIPISNFLEITRSGFALCPWHSDQHPSMKYYEDENRVHCFACGKHGDVIDIVREQRQIGFLDAVKWLLAK